MQIPARIIEILRASFYEEATIKLPTLDRSEYLAVADVLAAIGCKWDKKRKAMTFAGPDDNAWALVQPILDGDEILHPQTDLGYFPTPPELAAQVIDLADLRAGMRVLEPSAGQGALVIPALQQGAHLTCYEAWPANFAVLVDELVAAFPLSQFTLYRENFLTITPTPTFDRVIMNPPFGKRADIAHVLHAIPFLAPGGKLVAIMARGILFRNDMKSVVFRTLIERLGGSITPLPDESFKEAGTCVSTAVITLYAASKVTHRRVRLSKQFIESRRAA